MKPFVVYLDIDGVLVSYLHLKDRHPDGKTAFGSESVDALNAIIQMVGGSTDVEICVVSTWARGKSGEEMGELLRSRGLHVSNVTSGEIDDRAGYVIGRIQEGYDRYLIIDDESCEYYRRLDSISYNHILSTNSYRGLDQYDVVQVSRNLSRLVEVTQYDPIRKVD
jgi:hypothetical protein